MTQMLFNKVLSLGYNAFKLEILTSQGNVGNTVGDLRVVIGGVNYPTVNMTSNTLPIPLVASSDGGTNFTEPYTAFNSGSPGGGGWRAGSTGGAASLMINLGVFVAKPSSFLVTHEVGSNLTWMQKTSNFYGSTDGGSTWALLGGVYTDAPWTSGEQRTYIIP